MNKTLITTLTTLVAAGCLLSPMNAFAAPKDPDEPIRVDTFTGAAAMTDEEYRADLARIAPPKGESELAETAAKRSLMRSVLESNDAVSVTVGQIGRQAVPSYYYLSANWRGQQNWYYCGPAAMQMALSYQGLYPSQDSLAAQAGTNSWDGTTVSGLMNTLNGQGNGAYWSWAGLPSWPTSAQIEAFKGNMMAGISYQYAHIYATVGDAWMVADGPHLNAWHPKSEAFHYFTFRGYYDYARMVQYMDPYAGFGGNSIPQYSTIDAVTVVNVMGGRGYAY